jgi:hypothetical protein
MRGEEMAEIPAGSLGQNQLHLWVCPLVDGKIAADTVLSLETPVQIPARVSTVVAEGTPSEIAFRRSGDREYRMFHTVRML